MIYYVYITQAQGNIVQISTNLNVVCFYTGVNLLFSHPFREINKLWRKNLNVPKLQLRPETWLFFLLTSGYSPLSSLPHICTHRIEWCWEPLSTAHFQPPTIAHSCAEVWVVKKEMDMWSRSFAPFFVLGYFLSSLCKEKVLQILQLHFILSSTLPPADCVCLCA